jgi:hypothetical protein
MFCSDNCSRNECATVCTNATLCTGYDWSPSGNSLGACRARFPVTPADLPPGFQLDPMASAKCSNITGSNRQHDGATCYRKQTEPAFSCPMTPPSPPPPPPPPPYDAGVGCFKTQMSLYWLALAQAGVADPGPAERALLYQRQRP